MSEALDAIALEAGAGEAEQQAAKEAIENPPPLIDPGEAWAEVPAFFGSLLGLAMPELKEAYTPAACRQWGAAMNLVAEKYGWDAAATIARWAPEAALVGATIPLGMATYAAIKRRRPLTVKEGAKVAESNAPVETQPEGGDFSDPR